MDKTIKTTEFAKCVQVKLKHTHTLNSNKQANKQTNKQTNKKTHTEYY